jgi:hypothetical protein
LWALPLEGASLLLAAEQAARDDWDALVRRGVFLHPSRWGAAAPGTQGGEDTFPMVEVINANPAVIAMLPHAASVFHHFGTGHSAISSDHRGALWDPAAGRLVIDTPHTQALLVHADRHPARFATLTLECKTPGATLAVSSFGIEPLATANRLLATAVARVEPSGMTYADACHTATGFPGRPPLLCEPVVAKITWKTTAHVRAYRLDNSGKRASELRVETTREGAVVAIDGTKPGVHFELTTGN